MSNQQPSCLVARIGLKNVLSFGPSDFSLDLGPLNVLIGPNGSGKSNLIEVINLMRSAPRELRDVPRRSGGVAEWIWKGDPGSTASVAWDLNSSDVSKPVRHSLSFHSVDQRFELDDESIEESTKRSQTAETPYFYYRYNRGRPMVNTLHGGRRGLAKESVDSDRSILAQRRDPEAFPELSWLAQQYEQIRIYRDWTFGRNAPCREPQKADQRNDILEEDFSNLGLVLNRIRSRHPAAKKEISAGLKNIYDGIDDFDVQVEGGTVQIFLTEGNYSIPATRLSDGTLRYLCLLAILCDPHPPALLCIEEPELGLHPDLLSGVAELLKSASARTQILVTTHSEGIVDALTDTPGDVVVCEKVDGCTQMERLDGSKLEDWLGKYRLGHLWTSGEIGGNRW